MPDAVKNTGVEDVLVIDDHEGTVSSATCNIESLGKIVTSRVFA